MLKTIQLNDQNDIVKVAQYLLDCEPTGRFDSTFLSIVKSFQFEHDLLVDGIIGKNTWAAIVKTLPTCTTHKNKKTRYVYAIQLLVGTTVDGHYGSQTKKAVAAYQTAANLKADGECGPKTWSMLILGQATIFAEPTKNTIKNLSTQYNLDGEIIDISKHQGTIDFNALKSKVALVIARVSFGTTQDAKISTYAAQMDKLNIPYGVYCYSYATSVDRAKSEAQAMFNYSQTLNPLFYVLDAEESSLTTEMIKAFVTELRQLTTKPIGCYVAHHRYTAYKYNTIQSLFDFTWIPRYGSNTGAISGAVKPAYFCDLWQYTSTGKIDGISGNVDKNIITGDGRSLNWFLTNRIG